MVQDKLDAMDESQKQMVNVLTDNNLTPEEKLVIYMNKKNNDSYWNIDLFRQFMEDVKRL
jgi:hypothetical protein